MILSHYRAGSGAVLIETQEEGRLLSVILAELPETAEVFTIAAPGGQAKDARTGRNAKMPQGLPAAYAWAQEAPGRVLIVLDWHMLANSPGHWRMLVDAIPGLRSPVGAGETDHASLVVFVGPGFELSPANPLRGVLPVLKFELPDREALRAAADALHPLNGDAEAVIDSLCGLTTAAAEQAAAENLSASGGRYNPETLSEARRQLLRQSGLECWTPVAELGGLSGLQTYAENEVLPWVRDRQLAVKRILCAGVPGVGKSYWTRWLASRLRCVCARLSIPALKAGVVGASEGNLRRALGTIDALGRHAPVVVVLDEVDKLASDGMDGGTSSGMFSELLTWLQESTSQAVVIATLNHLDKLDAALESRFQARFFFDLPSLAERRAVAEIHYRRLGCDNVADAATATAACTEGFSSREIAEQVIPSVARQSGRKPTGEIIRFVAGAYTPASTTQAEQLTAMRRAASTLRLANDPMADGTGGIGRRVILN